MIIESIEYPNRYQRILRWLSFVLIVFLAAGDLTSLVFLVGVRYCALKLVFWLDNFED